MIRCLFRVTVNAMCLLSILAVTGRCATISDPISVQLTLRSSRVMLGEPIILHYRVVNNTDSLLWMKFSDPYGGAGGFPFFEIPAWLSVRTVGALNKVVPSRTDSNRDKFPGSKQYLYSVVLNTHDPEEGDIVLSLWQAPNTVGSYKVQVTYRIEFGRTDGDPDQNVSGSAILPLTVTVTNPTELKKKGEAWLSLAQSPKNVGDHCTAFKALASMPEEMAVPLWRELAFSKNTPPKGDFLRLLRDFLGTPAAIQVCLDLYKVNPRARLW
jgi:hypothetical protein